MPTIPANYPLSWEAIIPSVGKNLQGLGRMLCKKRPLAIEELEDICSALVSHVETLDSRIKSLKER